MPELPEVETTRRGLAPWLEGQQIARIVVRVPKLRWPVPPEFARRLPGAQVAALDRRAKWLLLRTDRGTALLHLGMTGSFRVLRDERPPAIHDHLDIVTGDGVTVRFNDPRRFGSATTRSSTRGSCSRSRQRASAKCSEWGVGKEWQKI